MWYTVGKPCDLFPMSLSIMAFKQNGMMSMILAAGSEKPTLQCYRKLIPIPPGWKNGLRPTGAHGSLAHMANHVAE